MKKEVERSFFEILIFWKPFSAVPPLLDLQYPIIVPSEPQQLPQVIEKLTRVLRES